MSDDLIEQLRLADEQFYNRTKCKSIMGEAADRIEALEAALREIARCHPAQNQRIDKTYLLQCCADIAYAALAGEKKDE